MSTRRRPEDESNYDTLAKKIKRESSYDGESDKILPLDTVIADARERRNTDPDSELGEETEANTNEEQCIICLQAVVDRAVLINCAHDRMCFACIKQWSEQSRKCPLCNSSIGSHIIHRIRSQYDYQKHYLPPLRTTPPPAGFIQQTRVARRTRTRRDTTADEIERDELDRAIEKRRWVYRHGLYAKHVASNAHTRFRPSPTPQQISSSPELQSRCQMFVRRELRVWPNLDVEFLTNFILSLAKAIDIRTEAAIKLVGEFLDLRERPTPTGGTIAEHFAHELYSYLRSPFRELPAYDAVVQYDIPANAEAAPALPMRTTSQNAPGPSRTRDRSSPGGVKIRKRAPSDPLDASPRDAETDSERDDWNNRSPSRSKGKGKSTRISRDRRDASKETPRQRERDDDRYRHGDRSGRRWDHSRHQPRGYDQYSRSERRDDDRWSRHTRSRRRSRSGQRLSTPAGWDNWFENDRQERLATDQRDHSSERSASSRSGSQQPHDDGSRTLSHSHYITDPGPPKSMSIHTGDGSEPQPQVPVDQVHEDYTNHHSLTDVADPKITTKAPLRDRPVRHTPIAAIRMHLRQPVQDSNSVPSTDGPDALGSLEARACNREAIESKSSSTITPIENQIELREVSEHASPKLTPGDELASAYPTPPLSDNPPTVPFTIRGAAARSKSQAAQLIPPDPDTSSSRSRLLARLEAAKYGEPSCNTNITTSHWSQKRTHSESLSDESGPRVSGLRTEKARNKQTSPQQRTPRPEEPGPQFDVAAQETNKRDSRSQTEAGLSVATEIERRLRLQARLAARKRDMAATTGHSSTTDGL